VNVFRATEEDVQEAGRVSPGGTQNRARKVSAVRRHWPEAAVRITFGVILAVDAGLKWRPGFRASYPSVLAGLAQGQPHWLQPWFNFLIRLQSPHPAAWACFAAVTESLLAAGLIAGLARKLVYAGGAAYSLMVWATAGTFGGPYTPEATDIGPAIAYAVVFCSLLAMSAHGLASRYSLDAVIERRVGWWHRLAEASGPKNSGRDASGAGAGDTSAASASAPEHECGCRDEGDRA
jgi:thiosulfate dehydrogenase (quinone) large subunit